VGAKRKQHSPKFKAQVAMAALSGAKTLVELAAEFGVHPTMISTWKQELVKHAGDIFERSNKKAADPQQVIDHLHRKIGQLQVERDFLARQPAIGYGAFSGKEPDREQREKTEPEGPETGVSRGVALKRQTPGTAPTLALRAEKNPTDKGWVFKYWWS
jgi:transposase-like protein